MIPGAFGPRLLHPFRGTSAGAPVVREGFTASPCPTPCYRGKGFLGHPWRCGKSVRIWQSSSTRVPRQEKILHRRRRNRMREESCSNVSNDPQPRNHTFSLTPTYQNQRLPPRLFADRGTRAKWRKVMSQIWKTILTYHNTAWRKPCWFGQLQPSPWGFWDGLWLRPWHMTHRS